MTPTLLGRIQTRIFLLVVLGVPWTLVLGPILPRPEGASLGDAYQVLFLALALVALIGVVWELVYHGLQQLRWEKDWPTLFGLLTGINEGIVVYLVLRLMSDQGWPFEFELDTVAFVVDFAVIWVSVWLAANGPMRVVFLRWRFRGGRIV